MQVYFTTVVRAAAQGRGGELVRLDWGSKRVLGRVPIAPADPVVPDPNPRGSTRGGRGVLLNGQELFVASYHSLHVFDRELTPIRRMSHHLFAGLHELAWEGDDIWATCTCLSCAVRIDKQGTMRQAWFPAEDPLIAGRFGLPPSRIDKNMDNRALHAGTSTTAPGHVHLNAVAMQNARPLILLNRYGCVVRLEPTEILVDDPTLRGCHNILVLEDGGFLINDTHNRAIRVYDPAGGERERIDLTEAPLVRGILRRHTLTRAACWLGAHGRPQRVFNRLTRNFVVTRPVFVRGLCRTGRGTVLAGISPAAILEIDLRTGRVIDAHSYSRDLRVCVHGLACTPE